MSNIYLMIVDSEQEAVDWITYCRAHMLYNSLPNCAGIYKMSQPPEQLKSASEGWNLYLLCHGNQDSIGGLKGKDLATRLSKNIIPKNTVGFIHLQSCQTGQVAARDFALQLGRLKYHVIIKAPAASATFTEEIGF